MSFPSVQQAPVYTPTAGSVPQQTAYIQQGRCGSCGVTLLPHPQTQLNQGAGGQHQMSAQGGVQSSGGTLQESHQFSQVSGKSYVGGQGGQQQAETTPGQVQSPQQSVAEAPAERAGEVAAEADKGSPGFDFAAFLSPLNRRERAERAAKAEASSQAQSAQFQAGQDPAGQAPARQAQIEQASPGQIQTGYGQPQKTGQIQSGRADYSQGAQAPQFGQVTTGQTQSGQVQAGHGQPQMTGQIQTGGAGYSRGAQLQSGQGTTSQVQSGYGSQGGQVQPSHTQAGYAAPVQHGQTSSLSGYPQTGQTQQLDTSAVHQTAQQPADASAGGQLMGQSSSSLEATRSQALSDSDQSHDGFVKNIFTALGGLGQGIQQMQGYAVDTIKQQYVKTAALADQQREFLRERGVVLDKERSGAEAPKEQPEAEMQPAGSGANVQQKYSDTTKGAVKSK